MTEEERKSIVLYRIENAKNTLIEVESHCRNGFYNTAVNRMYYACFYATSALLIAHKIQVKSHDGVRQQFGLHFILTGILSQEYGRFYSLIFAKRTAGDYEDFITHDRETAEALYSKSKDFVSKVQILVDEWLNKK